MNKPKHNCDFCDKPFSSNAGKKIHMSICSQKDSEKANCDLCDKTFDSKSVLEQHCKSTHPNTVKCSICAKSFNQLKDLTKHLKSVHDNRKEKQVCNLRKLVFDDRKVRFRALYF